MGDFSVVWLKQPRGPCVLCGAVTGVGAVGWRHQGDPVGPVCDTMLDREDTLGELLEAGQGSKQRRHQLTRGAFPAVCQALGGPWNRDLRPAAGTIPPRSSTNR